MACAGPHRHSHSRQPLLPRAALAPPSFGALNPSGPSGNRPPTRSVVCRPDRLPSVHQSWAHQLVSSPRCWSSACPRRLLSALPLAAPTGELPATTGWCSPRAGRMSRHSIARARHLSVVREHTMATAQPDFTNRQRFDLSATTLSRFSAHIVRWPTNKRSPEKVHAVANRTWTWSPPWRQCKSRKWIFRHKFDPAAMRQYKLVGSFMASRARSTGEILTRRQACTIRASSA